MPNQSSDLLANAGAHRASFWQRWIVVVWVSLGAGVQYTMRNNLSIAIKVMPKEYGWSDGWDGPLLSSFFIGYAIGQIPSSLAARRWGGKLVLGLAILATSLLNAIIPLVGSIPELVAVLRVLSGMAQSATFPTCYHLFSVWTLDHENSRVVACMHFLGDTGGTLIGFLASEQLLDMSFPPLAISGLQLVFWTWSVLAVFWVTIWMCFFPDREKRSKNLKHATCSTTVQPLHLNSPPVAMGVECGVVRNERCQIDPPSGVSGVPWLALLCNPTLISLYATHAAGNMVAYALLTELPLFLKDAKADPAITRLATTLPYVANLLVMLPVGVVADALIARGASRTIVRKFFEAVAKLGSAAALLGAAYAPHHGISVALLTAASYGLFGACTAGYSAAYLEVAPTASGQAFALSNTIATLPGIAAPLIVEACTNLLGPVDGFRAAFALFGFGAGLPALAAFLCLFRAEPVDLRSGVRAELRDAEADEPSEESEWRHSH